MTESAVDSVAHLAIGADAGELSRASVWLGTVGPGMGVPAEQIRRLDLCLNEALANIISHGGPDATSSPVQLHFQVHSQPGSDEASLTVSDGGIAFDPLAHKAKARPQTLADAEPGGLGILMMHEFSDQLSYRYSEGRNQTTFTVRWAEEA